MKKTASVAIALFTTMAQLNIYVIHSEISVKQEMEKYERIKEKLKVLICSTQAVTFLIDVLVVWAK